MAERELKVKFTGDTKGLEKSLTRSQSAVKSASDKISKAGQAMAAGLVAGASAAVAFGVKSVDTYKNVGGEVLKLQRYTGDTAENASRMRAAFKLTGIDTDKAARSFGIFSKNIAAGKIDKLGIDLKDAHGQMLPFDQALGKVADKIASMPPGTARTALAIQAFGKAGTDMLPFLSKGSKGILELANQSDKLGTTLSGKDIGAIKSSKEESRKFGLAMEGLQIQIGRYVLPVLTDLTRWATEHLIPALDRFGRKVRDWLVPHLEKLSDWWDTKGHPAFDRFVKWIKESLLPVLDKVAKDIVDKIVGSFQKMVDWMAKHPKWAQPILDGFIAMIAMIAFDEPRVHHVDPRPDHHPVPGPLHPVPAEQEVRRVGRQAHLGDQERVGSAGRLARPRRQDDRREVVHADPGDQSRVRAARPDDPQDRDLVRQAAQAHRHRQRRHEEEVGRHRVGHPLRVRAVRSDRLLDRRHLVVAESPSR